MSNTKFYFESGLPVVKVQNDKGTLTLSQYGATVLSWIPAGKEDVLWLSPYTPWKQGAAIRGGIPVCFPWFGPKRDHSDWPLHGYIRNQVWNVDSVCDKDGDTTVTLSIDTKDLADRTKYGYGPAFVTLAITLGDSLTMKFSVTNTGDQDFSFENGLHTYFAGNPTETTFSSLEGTTYYDKVNDYKKCVRTGDFRFDSTKEMAHFHVNTPDSISYQVGGRKVTVEHDGFKSMILWSPGEKNGSANPELKDGWDKFFCIESGNVIDNTKVLKKGETDVSVLKISL